MYLPPGHPRAFAHIHCPPIPLVRSFPRTLTVGSQDCNPLTEKQQRCGSQSCSRKSHSRKDKFLPCRPTSTNNVRICGAEVDEDDVDQLKVGAARVPAAFWEVADVIMCFKRENSEDTDAARIYGC
jgi:hypothetical protein